VTLFKLIGYDYVSRKNDNVQTKLPLGSAREISGRKMEWLEGKKGETN
jgi:hypothetical protein